MSPEDRLPGHHVPLGRSFRDTSIEQVLPFTDMTEEQSQDILNRASLRRIAPKDTYFFDGDKARNFYILIDGVLRVVRTTADGEQVVILHISPGQMFGIAKAFDNDTYHATAMAISGGLALSWPSELWDQFVRDYPGFRAATRRAVGKRVDELQEKIVEMATLQVEQRIAHAILRLVRQVGKETPEGVEIGFPLTRQDISDMTGTTLHSVSRYLSKWQKAGIVSSSRRRVVVHKLNGLPI